MEIGGGDGVSFLDVKLIVEGKKIVSDIYKKRMESMDLRDILINILEASTGTFYIKI